MQNVAHTYVAIFINTGLWCPSILHTHEIDWIWLRKCSTAMSNVHLDRKGGAVRNPKIIISVHLFYQVWELEHMMAFMKRIFGLYDWRPSDISGSLPAGISRIDSLLTNETVSETQIQSKKRPKAFFLLSRPPQYTLMAPLARAIQPRTLKHVEICYKYLR